MLFEYKKIASLNDTERTVYRYFMNHIDDQMDSILQMSVRDIAAEAYTSPAAILRFCKKMGCNGLDDFKEQLKQYIRDKYALDQMDDMEYIMKSLDFIHDPSFQEKKQVFASLAMSHDQIIFMGEGNSAALARYGARYFSNYNCFAVYIDDPFYPVPEDASKVLLVILSETGETKEMYKKVTDYKNAGADIVLITNHTESVIASNSDLVISYSVPEHYLIQTYNITTAVPVVYMLETLAGELAKKVYVG